MVDAIWNAFKERADIDATLQQIEEERTLFIAQREQKLAELRMELEIIENLRRQCEQYIYELAEREQQFARTIDQQEHTPPDLRKFDVATARLVSLKRPITDLDSPPLDLRTPVCFGDVCAQHVFKAISCASNHVIIDALPLAEQYEFGHIVTLEQLHELLSTSVLPILPKLETPGSEDSSEVQCYIGWGACPEPACNFCHGVDGPICPPIKQTCRLNTYFYN